MTDRAGTVRILKIARDAAPADAGSLRALEAVLSRLRARGYPAPRFHAIGHSSSLVFRLQQVLPGFTLDHGEEGPDHMVLTRLLPELIRLNDAQAGLGNGERRLRDYRRDRHQSARPRR